MTPSHWAVVDALMRELGSLRDQARRLDRAWGQEVKDDVERLIGEASRVVSRTLDGPESDALLVAACEAIVAARDYLDSLSSETSLPRGDRAATRRRKRALLLFERIRGNKVRADVPDGKAGN